MRQFRRGNRGSSIVEFALLGIPIVMLIVSVFEISLAMWTYVTLGYAVREGARYSVTKGQGCSFTGNTCSVKVSDIAQRIRTAGTGLDPGTLNITLSASDGSTVSCSPLTNCYSNATVWPPATANLESNVATAASSITVTGTYAFKVICMPLSTLLQTSSGQLQASSQQFILF